MMSWTTQITGIWDPQEEQLEATNTKQVHLEVPKHKKNICILKLFKRGNVSKIFIKYFLQSLLKYRANYKKLHKQ